MNILDTTLLCALLAVAYFEGKFLFWISPPEIIHICQRIIQSSKHFLNAFSGIDFTSRRKISFMSSIDWKRVPRSGNLSSGKRERLAGEISGEYGGCSMIFVEFLAFTWLRFRRKFMSRHISHLDRFWMHGTTHLHVFFMKSIHHKPSVTFSASKRFLTISLSRLFE